MIFKWEIRLWIFFLNLLIFFSIFQFFFFGWKRIKWHMNIPKTFYFNFRNIFPTFYTWQEIWYKKNLLCDEGFFFVLFEYLILGDWYAYQIMIVFKWFLSKSFFEFIYFYDTDFTSLMLDVFLKFPFFYISINYYWSGH